MTQTTKKPAAKSTPTKTVDDYLAAAPKERRAALMKLHRTIKAAAPTAIESMSYGIAGFKHRSGKPLIYFGYWRDHYAIYGTGSALIDTHAAELKPYAVSKGTIRLPFDKPLPHRLVTKIVKARIAEIEKTG